jgi:hypothetical protein
VLLADVSSLSEAIRWRRLFAPGLHLELRLPQLDPAKHRELQSAVQRHSKACGCREGGWGAALLLVMYSFAMVLNVWRPRSTFSAAAAGFGVAALGALAGKVLGLAYARLSLRYALRAAMKELRTTSRLMQPVTATEGTERLHVQ